MLPYVNQREKQKVETNQFLGYVHKPYCPDGAWYDMENLCADEFPLLSTRKLSLRSDYPHTMYTPIVREKHFLFRDGTVKDCIVEILMYKEMQKFKLATYVSYAGRTISKIYDEEWDTFCLGNAVSFGNDIILFPVNRILKWDSSTENFELDQMEATGVGGNVFVPCDKEGTPYDPTVSASEPETKTDGMVWCDTSDGGIVYKRWSVTYLRWETIPHVYAKTATSISEGEIKEGDTVYIQAMYDTGHEVDGYHEIIKKVGAEIVVTAALAGPLECWVNISRKVPDMDFIVECNNRIWGCKYGVVDGEFVNEIYCSKLGDPKNWRSYSGISTDSWAASNGTDGPWTGAINYNGSPWFFKENSATRVYISSTGAHQSVDYKIPGVQKSSWKSLENINGTLFYKGIKGVYVFDGSNPVMISTPLGNEIYTEAMACTDRTRYHIVMTDRKTKKQKYFIYDTGSKTWLKYNLPKQNEDDPYHVVKVYEIDEAMGYAILQVSYYGTIVVDVDMEEELNWYASVPITKHDWSATSGIQYYLTPEKKYIGRYSFRIELEEGSTFELEIEYDSNGEWIPCGEITGDRHGCYTLPVIPRRCDHLRYRISGTGQMKLYSITREMEASTEK